MAAPAGAHAQAPTWWGADHWLKVALPAAYARRERETSRHHPVTLGTCVLVAREFARYADHRTGRNCRPTNELIAARARVCVRTVQRVRRLLEDLGLMVELVRGRSILTRTERLQAWRAGSTARQIASEVALCLPRWLARVVHNLGPRPVERVTPPGDSEGERVSHLGRGFFESGRTDRRSQAPPGTHRKRRPPRATLAQARSSRLIAELQRTVGWLSGVSPRRLTALHRFAAQGWTERDVRRAVDDVLRARRWSIPPAVANPPAYLAALLRDVDPNDRPGAADEQREAEAALTRRWERLTIFGPECAHGQPAGDVPHPLDGHLACPFCRHERHHPCAPTTSSPPTP